MHSWFWRQGFATQSADVLARDFQACKQGHANLLLNLSPDKSGRLPDESVRVMDQLAKLIR
jgi:hypothetical protein